MIAGWIEPRRPPLRAPQLIVERCDPEPMDVSQPGRRRKTPLAAHQNSRIVNPFEELNIAEAAFTLMPVAGQLTAKRVVSIKGVSA